MAKKIKCYELDFGDTNLIVEDPQGILEWIKADMEMLGEKGYEDVLNYTINLKFMTRKQIEELPEWS